MDDDRRFPWLNAWMILFGGFGIWAFVHRFAQYPTYWNSHRSEVGLGVWESIIEFLRRPAFWTDYWQLGMGLLIPAAILLVGILRMPNLRRSVSSKGHSLDDLGRVYLGACRTIRSHRWILGIFAAVALVQLIGGTADSFFSARIRDGFSRPAAGRNSIMPLSTRISDTLTYSYPLGLQRARRGLMPSYVSRATGTTIIIYAVVFLLAVIWFGRKLRSISADEQYADGVRFAQTILLPVAIATLGTAAVTAKMMVMALATYVREAATPGGNPALRVSQEIAATFGGKRQDSIIHILITWEAEIFFVAVSGLIIAGLAGSFVRMQRNGPVTRGTFIRDIARYFKPVFGVYILLALISTLLRTFYMIPFTRISAGELLLPLWTYVALLFVLAPYAVVRFNLGALDAMRRSARDLRRNAWDSLSFAALGLSFFGPLLIIYYGIHRWLMDSPILGIWRLGGETTVYNLIAVVAAPVMAIALWNFYSLISPEQPE